ncbi:MAG: serine hydrolase domain-containing protein [Pseudomonadota bacterium]
MIRALLAAASLTLAACALETSAPAPDRAAHDARLAALVTGDGDPAHALAGTVLVVMRGEETVYAGAAGRARIDPVRGDRALTPETKFRWASVSKMVVGMTALDLEREGAVNLDANLSEALGWPLHRPDDPARAITLRQALDHTSSIRDPAAYWVPLPGNIRTLFEGEAAPFSAHTPGDWFEYANLNYGLAATAMEAATGERFDRLAARMLNAAGLDAGFNWSGVSAAARRSGATLYRKVDGVWTPQVDDLDTLEDHAPLVLKDEGANLADYTPGTNGTLFSPQGGLRASAVDLARLVRLLRAPRYAPLSSDPWVYDPARPNGTTAEAGVSAEGLFTAYGLGVQLLPGDVPTAAWPGETLIGHSGDAYGLLSGAWVQADGDVAFAYAITGVNADINMPPGERTAFTLYEEKLLDLAREIAAAD